MFDPTLPANNAPLVAAEMRGQLTALKALIDALVSITNAQVDGVTTLPPGSNAAAGVSLVGSTLHFIFDLPQGADGQPGEVTSADLANALSTTSSNSNGVSTLSMAPNDPPTAYDVQQITDKLNELITALRRP